MAKLLSFPNDENGDVLHRMQANGDDLSKARSIDFTIVFPNESSAAEFARHFSQLGYRTTLENIACTEDFPWDVVVVKHMPPTHSGITLFEDQLNSIAKPLGGRNDGWGCFEQ